MITNFPCSEYFRELAAWEHDYVETNVEVVAESLQRAPIASASETGHSEKLAGDER